MERRRAPCAHRRGVRHCACRRRDRSCQPAGRTPARSHRPSSRAPQSSAVRSPEVRGPDRASSRSRTSSSGCGVRPTPATTRRRRAARTSAAGRRPRTRRRRRTSASASREGQQQTGFWTGDVDGHLRRHDGRRKARELGAAHDLGKRARRIHTHGRDGDLGRRPADHVRVQVAAL